MDEDAEDEDVDEDEDEDAPLFRCCSLELSADLNSTSFSFKCS